METILYRKICIYLDKNVFMLNNDLYVISFLALFNESKKSYENIRTTLISYILRKINFFAIISLFKPHEINKIQTKLIRLKRTKLIT